MNSDGGCQVNLTNDPADDWSPAFSPNGTKIAFAHFFDGNQFSDIAVINTGGSGMQRLTTSHGEYPAWSPDGTQIAFASARDGNYEIYVMNADGTDQTRLTDDPAYDMSPVWSPDGKQIAFERHELPRVSTRTKSFTPTSTARYSASRSGSVSRVRTSFAMVRSHSLNICWSVRRTRSFVSAESLPSR